MLGIPSVFAIVAYIAKIMLKLAKKITILMDAQQAQMRGQLLDKYHEYIKRGSITDMELTEWINQYNAYHSLGANGVLDKRKEELLNLPTQN